MEALEKSRVKSKNVLGLAWNKPFKLWVVFAVLASVLYVGSDQLAIYLGGENCSLAKHASCQPAMLDVDRGNGASDYSYSVFYLMKEANPSNYNVMYLYSQVQMYVGLAWLLVSFLVIPKGLAILKNSRNGAAAIVTMSVTLLIPLAMFFAVYFPVKAISNGSQLSYAYTKEISVYEGPLDSVAFYVSNAKAHIVYPDRVKDFKRQIAEFEKYGKQYANQAEGSSLEEKVSFLKAKFNR